MSSNTKSYAENELDILQKTVEEPIVGFFIPEILALVDKFGNSGQSGGSAPFTAEALSSTIKKLCLQQPICPITGIEDEWNNVSESGDGSLMNQNNRCSALFKADDDKPYYLDAIVWKTEKGGGWSGSAQLSNGEKITSRQYVKSFPFKPKTFYIDVIEKEVAKDDWEFYVKDENQLIEVFEYYDLFKPESK